MRVQVIGMEACSGSHFLGRALRAQGHEVRLMPAQYVKPYVKTNKSDYIDAEAIAEAVQRPTMRFVPIKTEEQLDLQAAASGARALGDAKNRGGQPDSRSASGTWTDSAQGPEPSRCRRFPRSWTIAELKLSGSFRVLLAQLQVGTGATRGDA